MIEIKVGVTGTRYGISDLQMLEAKSWLQKPFWGRDYVMTEFHHGDCVGADAQLASLVREYHPDAKIVGHPPDKEALRVFFESDETLPEKPYLARNKDIVDATEMLIGFPSEPEKQRSGTWSTIRYAVKQKKRVGVFNFDGTKETK